MVALTRGLAVCRRSPIGRWTAATVILAAACAEIGVSGGLAAASVKPSPRDWEQWQPQTDAADVRLDSAHVTVWQSDVTVAELLACVSKQSGVSLSAVDDLRTLHLTVYGEGRPLLGLLVALSTALDGYWAFPRGSPADGRVYLLIPYEMGAESVDEYEQRLHSARLVADAARNRAARERRMALYESALSLTREELLNQFEQSDPWLCADLVDPATRPMIGYVCTLSSAQKEQLLARGRLSARLGDLQDSFRSHLARWAKAEWGLPGGVRPVADPDRLFRFDSPEDRWGHGTVTLLWYDDHLGLRLDVPDVQGYLADLMQESSAEVPPRGARERLIALGVRQDTAEYRAAVDEEERQWRAKTGPAAGASRLGPLAFADIVAAPDTVDPRLSGQVAVDSDKVPLPVADALSMAARQLGLPVVGPYLPSEIANADLAENAGASLRLLDVLQGVRRERGGMFTWRFSGGWLAASDAGQRLVEAAGLPKSVLARLDAAAEAGGAMSVDEFAALLAPLNGPQLSTLAHTFPGMSRLPLLGLRIYGRLTDGQRTALAQGSSVSVPELAAEATPELLSFAQVTHPWLDGSGLQRARLRSLSRRLSAGDPGLSVVLLCDPVDDPQDRDVLFTSSLTVLVRARVRR